jgi:hypothetical protein
MVVHTTSDYPSRPPPPSDASFSRIRGIPSGPPAPAASRGSDNRSRLTHPPSPAPKAAAAAKPKPKEDVVQLQFPRTPLVAFDRREAPGCFDIVGRGNLPRITFSTEVAL